MLKTFICWLWGHETVVKVYDGSKIKQKNFDGVFWHQEEVLLYELERLDYCRRCGKKTD